MYVIVSTYNDFTRAAWQCDDHGTLTGDCTDDCSLKFVDAHSTVKVGNVYGPFPTKVGAMAARDRMSFPNPEMTTVTRLHTA